jgi:hypothetical protein
MRVPIIISSSLRRMRTLSGHGNGVFERSTRCNVAKYREAVIHRENAVDVASNI